MESSSSLNNDDERARETTPLMGRSGLLLSQAWTPRVHTQCPTCNGQGKIKRDALKNDELVALIPVGDKRLRPRHTKLIVAGTFLVTALVIGIILYFVYPRSVNVTLQSGVVTDMKPVCWGDQPRANMSHPDGTGGLKTSMVTIKWQVMVHNFNYFPVHFNNLNVIVDTIRGSMVGNQATIFPSIGPKQNEKLFFKTNLTFYDKNVPKPPPPGSNVSLSNHSYTMPSFKACLQERDPGMDNIFTVSFQSNYTMSILSFSSNQSMDTLVKVYCTEPAPPIGPPIPNTTTTTTSSTTTTTTTSTTTTTPPTTPNTTNTTTTTPHMEEYYANPVPVKELPYWDEEPRGSVGEPIGSADILPYGHVCGIDG